MAIPENVRDCCCFIYENIDGKHHMRGTGFFIGESYVADGDEEGTIYVRKTERGTESLRYIYLVTAKHVIDKIKEHTPTPSMGVRLNVAKGNTVDVDIPIDAWFYHPTDSSVDAAVALPITEFTGLDIRSLPLEIAMNDEIIKKYSIGIGDEVHITGLFHKYYGIKRNLPILRTGNIAMMPKEKIKVTGFGDIDAYLIELRSIGGLSGSPVFVHLQYPEGNNIRNLLFWMGLMHGHWNIDVVETDISDITHKDASEKQQLNVGIGIVVPAYKILEIIKRDEIRKAKEMGRKSSRKEIFQQQM
jgi:hypothetical protein